MPNLQMPQTLVCTLAPTLIGNTESSDAIIAPGAELTELFSDAHFTEGPTVAPNGTVYFSDITFTDQTDMPHIIRYNNRICLCFTLRREICRIYKCLKRLYVL